MQNSSIALVHLGHLRLKFRITAGPGAADPAGLEAREIYVELAGPDAGLLTQRGGELLRALEHVAAKVLRLENEEHDKISFDAENFKALRARELKLAAETAAERVRRTGQPYSFAPMSSRERRMLHLAFRGYTDLETASSGEGMRRYRGRLSEGLRTPRFGAAREPLFRTPPVNGRATRRAARELPTVQPHPQTKNGKSIAQETIVAISTPPGRGGIGIVRLSGPHAVQIAQDLVRISAALEHARARLDRRDRSGTTTRKIDEAIVTYFARPNSYTGEDLVEIAAHGSPVVLEMLVRMALRAGARLARPGEFTERAFLAGRLDLTQAEAVRDLIEAQTLYQARVAAEQMGGALSRRIQPAKQNLVELIALLEAGIDFAEDDVEITPDAEIVTRIDTISRRSCRRSRDPLSTAAWCTAGCGWRLSDGPTWANRRCSTGCWSANAPSSPRSLGPRAIW